MAEYLIVVLLIVLNIQAVFLVRLAYYIMLETPKLDKKLSDIENQVKKRGFVTPPFEAANPDRSIRGTSPHIVQRKTPDQIRNENFKKIEEGQTYGSY